MQPTEKAENTAENIATLDNKGVFIKRGRFGQYLAWNGVHVSCTNMAITPVDAPYQPSPYVFTADDEIRLKNAAEKHTNKKAEGSAPLFGPRRLTPTIELCRTRTGAAYALYNPPHQALPTRIFFSKFTHGDPLKCSNQVVLQWIADTYHITI
jgi:hypothetical protein